METSDSEATVLVVDDEQDVADVYALGLSDTYETRVAYGGTAALEEADQTVDVVLLDRRMPDMAGDEVLEHLREREVGCRVIMLTAVDPDFDIMEMPFDEYIRKPTTTDELKEAIEQQLSAKSYDDNLSEYLEVTTKLRLLEEEKTDEELTADEQVQELRERAADLRTDLDETVTEFDDATAAFRDLV